jgi:hypothetical protein
MGLFGTNRGQRLDVEHILPPAEPDVTVEAARIAQAVSVIDEALAGGREGHGRFLSALLEVRHALAPGMRPLDPPVPVIPGRSS